MNLNRVFSGKKFRYGSVSVALTVVIIAAVILVNAIVTAVFHENEMFVDMTANDEYTLSDAAKEFLAPVAQEQRRVKIIFCSAEDAIDANTYTHYAYHTAKQIREYFQDELDSDCVELEFVDFVKNPTKIKPYFKGEGTLTPNAYSIILAGQVFDEEANAWKDAYTRVYSATALYSYDSTSGLPAAYNGEQRLVSGILTVTQTQQPVVCFTKNHGETLPEGTAFKVLLEDCGFKVLTIDLRNEEIPEACSLIVINNPKTDFTAHAEYSDVSEIDKLEKFLDEKNAMMVFFDSETGSDNNSEGELKVLEQYLGFWGIGLARQSDDSGMTRDCYMIEDTTENRLSTVANIGQYVKGGLGRNINDKMLSMDVPPTVLFPRPAALINTYRDKDVLTDKNTGVQYDVYKDDSNMTTRRCFDVFESSKDAVAMLNGKAASSNGPYTYMKITQETHSDSFSQSKEAYSYVLACSSTDFVSNGALVGQYGNHSILTRACSEMGVSSVSVSIDAKVFVDTTIETITEGAQNFYAITFSIIPAAVVFVVGTVIMIRRRYR